MDESVTKQQLREMEQMKAVINDQIDCEKERLTAELENTWLDDNDLMDVINQVCLKKYQRLVNKLSND